MPYMLSPTAALPSRAVIWLREMISDLPLRWRGWRARGGGLQGLGECNNYIIIRSVMSAVYRVCTARLSNCKVLCDDATTTMAI